MLPKARGPCSPARLSIAAVTAQRATATSPALCPCPAHLRTRSTRGDAAGTGATRSARTGARGEQPQAEARGRDRWQQRRWLGGREGPGDAEPVRGSGGRSGAAGTAWDRNRERNLERDRERAGAVRNSPAPQRRLAAATASAGPAAPLPDPPATPGDGSGEGSREGSLLQPRKSLRKGLCPRDSRTAPAAAGKGPLCAHLTWHLPQSHLITAPASPPSHGCDLEAVLRKPFLRILHCFRSFSSHLLTHRLRDVGPSSELPLPSFTAFRPFRDATTGACPPSVLQYMQQLNPLYQSYEIMHPHLVWRASSCTQLPHAGRPLAWGYPVCRDQPQEPPHAGQGGLRAAHGQHQPCATQAVCQLPPPRRAHKGELSLRLPLESSP